MPCRVVKLEGGGTAIVCSRGGGRRRRQVCCVCGAPASLLCDWPMGNGKTCDRPMCYRHSHAVDLKTDYCPEYWREKEGGA